jgi:hypothetical protein
MTTVSHTASERLRRLARRTIVPLGLILLVFATQIGSSFYPHLVENYYSRGLYPRVLTVVSVIGRAVPAISIAEILLGLLLLVLTIGAIIKLFRSRSLREIPDLLRQHKSEHGRYSVRTLKFLLRRSASALLRWLEKEFPILLRL